MYVWIGLGMEKSEQDRIRMFCRAVNREGASETAFSLPQHVSMKLSFDTPKWQAVIAYLKSRLHGLQRFSVRTEGIQSIPGLCWLKIQEDARLRALHNALNRDLEAEFSIPRKGFDGDGFAFHSTLFYDPQAPQKIAAIFQRIRNTVFYSKQITLNTVYFGISETGKAGEYRIVDQLPLA